MEEKETIAGIPAEKAREIIETRKATNEANRVPFPGPLRQAFAVTQNIQVGPYSVRPFYEGDFEWLQELNHPLHKMMDKDSGDDAWTEDLTKVRGQAAWNICYLMTTPAEEIESMQDSPDGMKQLQAKAKEKFRRSIFGDLIALQTAIIKQFTICMSPVVGFDQVDEEGTKKKQS